MQKNTYKIKRISNFGPKMSYLCILDRNLKKLLPNLNSAPSNLPKYEDSRKANSRNTNLKLKLPYVGVFGLIFEINYCHIRKSAPANLYKCKYLGPK